MTPFKPILYLKMGCPHCFKLRLFLLEAGLSDRFEERGFSPGDPAETTIRAELTAQFDRVTFPTAQIAPGIFLNDSDVLIARYAAMFAIDLAALPLFTAYTGSILPRYQALRRENRMLREA